MQARANVFTRCSEIAAGALVALASAALLAMMFLMAADVVCRYFFNSPISGALETIEYLMAIIIPLSIAYCGSLKSHVAVDLVAERLPRTIRKAAEFTLTLVSLVFIAMIAWQNYAYAIETYRSNLTSAVLKIPAYPFVGSIAVGMTAFAVVLLKHLFALESEEISNGSG